MLNKAVYRERDINMDHLGPDRTIKFLQEKNLGGKLRERPNILLVIPGHVCTKRSKPLI